MVKTLFITNYPAPYRVEFFNQLGNRVDLTVVFMSTPEQQTHRSRDWFNTDYSGFKPVFLQKQMKIGPKIIYKDIIDVIKNGFDHIIFGGYSTPTFMYAINYLIDKKIPFIMEADGGLVQQDSFAKKAIKKHFLGAADMWLSSGKATTDYFLAYGARKNRIVEYPFSSMNAKDMEEASSSDGRSKADIREELGITEKNVVITVGQFIPRKGIDVLVRSSGSFPADTGVYIIGAEPDEGYIKLADEHGKNVHYIGFKPKDKIKEYYRCADVFVMPTREDVWGLVVCEALSFGLPVISSDRCGAGLSLITEGENDYIVPVNDENAIAEKVAYILDGELDSYRESALQSVKDRTIEAMVEAHLKVLL